MSLLSLIVRSWKLNILTLHADWKVRSNRTNLLAAELSLIFCSSRETFDFNRRRLRWRPSLSFSRRCKFKFHAEIKPSELSEVSRLLLNDVVVVFVVVCLCNIERKPISLIYLHNKQCFDRRYGGTSKQIASFIAQIASAVIILSAAARVGRAIQEIWPPIALKWR